MPLQKNADRKKGWSPGNRYIISSDSDWVIARDAEARQTAWNVPPENCFTLSDESTLKGGRHKLRQQLSKLTKDDRLDITGHGSSGSFENMEPHEIVELLKKHGLKEVGVIKFHHCNSGIGDFLGDVGHELQRGSNKVDYGHLSGIKGASINDSKSHTIFGKRFNIGLGSFVSHGSDGFGNFMKHYVRSLLVVPEAIALISKKEYFHVKTVPGNISMTVHGTRYKRDASGYMKNLANYEGVGSTASVNRESYPVNREYSDRGGRTSATYRGPTIDSDLVTKNEALLKANKEYLTKIPGLDDSERNRIIEEDQTHLDRQKRFVASRDRSRVSSR